MKVSCFTALVVAGLHTAGALDLTPINSFRDLEGVKIPVVAFEDGPRKVNWQPPDNWQLSGGGKQLNLYPGKTPLAGAQLKLIAPEAARPPDRTAALDALLKWAKNFVPADSTGLTFAKETSNPFLLGDKQSREFTFNYVSTAKKCITSVALVDLNAEQSLAFVITARAEDFQEIYSAGTMSMVRWRWLSGPITPQDVTAANAPASAR